MCFSLFRPFSEDDVKAKTPVVVTCNEDKQEVIVTQNIGNKQTDKIFGFDKVCLFLNWCLFIVLYRIPFLFLDKRSPFSI